MDGLADAVNGILEKRGFARNEPEDRSYPYAVYSKGMFHIELHLNAGTHHPFTPPKKDDQEKNEPAPVYRSSRLCFTLDGKLREGANRENFLPDLDILREKSNAALQKEGVEFVNFFRNNINGDGRIQVNGVVLEYEEDPRQVTQVAYAIGVMQDSLFQFLLKYIEPAKSSD